MPKRLLELAALLALGLLLSACFGSSPASTVKKFHRLIEDGQVEESMRLISRQSLSNMGEDKVRSVLRMATQQINDQGGIDELRIESEEVTGEVARVSVFMEYGNGKTEFSDVELALEDGDWKILLGSVK